MTQTAMQELCGDLIKRGLLDPIPLPRSWPHEHLARWESMPRDLQLYLSDREAQREKIVRRAQNIAAEAQSVLKKIAELTQ